MGFSSEDLWYNGVMVKETEKEIVNWDAKEYIPHDKNKGWYVGLVAVGLLFSAGAVWLEWWTFLVLIILSVVSLWIYAARPPRVLDYSLGNKGISEGNKLYNYEDFRAFGVLREGENFAIVLVPRKRFSAGVKVYFPEERGEKIVDAFGARLPMEEVKLDFLDKIVNFLRI